jgi:O-acetylhomoserine/O-acetylserine sulfhydrylase-like pyridoxal-dependent enzyme
VRFADHRDPASFAPLIDARTKAIFCESVGNPLGNITDFEALAAIAHAHGIPLIVDNTVPSPYLCRPIEHGADIVVHSLTKYIGGHGTSIGGIIVDSGKFPWAEHKERFRRLNEPDVSYHGVVYTEALGPAAYIGRARVVPLRNMGAAISPFNAFLILQGVETLALRMDRICESTLKVAEFLKATPRSRGSTTPACPTIPTTPWAEVHGRPRLRHPQLRRERRWQRPGSRRPLPGRSSWSPAWRTSATARAWPAIRRPPPTASSRRKR